MSTANYKPLEETPPSYAAPGAGYVPHQSTQNQMPPPAYEFKSEKEVPPGGAYYSPPPQYYPNTSGVVINCQPPSTVVVNTRSSTRDHFFILSVLMTGLCCLCFSWFALFCTIPAIFFALSAQEAESRGDAAGMKRNRHLAFILNVAAVVVYVVCLVILLSSTMRTGYYNYYH